MKNYKAIYFFALMAFLVLGCEEETQQIYQETSSTIVDDIKLSFNLDNFDDPVGAVKGNVEVLWDEYTNQIIEGQEWQEYRIKELRPRMYSQDSTGTYMDREKGYNFTLLATMANGNPEFYLAKMVSYSHPEERSFFSLEEDNFHGLLYIYDMRGVPAYIMHYEKGEVLNKIENLEVAQEVKQLSDTIATARCMEKASTVAKCDTALGCALSTTDSCGGGGSPAGSGWVAVPTDHYTDWYNMRPTGAEYSHTQYNGSTTEYVWVVSTTTYAPSSGSYNFGIQHTGGATSYIGGGVSGNSSISTYNTSQNNNRNELCGGYKWKKIGSSHTVNITELGFTAINPRTRKLLNYDYPNLCVSIPEYRYLNGVKQTITADIATTKFNLAWRQAVNRTLLGLSPTETSSFKAATELMKNLKEALSTAAAGSTITQGICHGDVNTNEARYCL